MSLPVPVGFLPLSKVKAHLKKVREREKSTFGDGELSKRIEFVTKTINGQIDLTALNTKIHAIINSPSYEQALTLAREVIEVFSSVASPYAACKKGCGYCCHVPVAVTASEAAVIAKAIQRPLSQPPRGRAVTVLDIASRGPEKERSNAINQRVHNGTPCTFLKNGECSIYEHRPIACRQQINMDIDALLCQLVKGHTITVPYLNLQNVEQALLLHMIESPKDHMNEQIADIRDWFR